MSNPNVTAIIWSGMGGQEGGSALVDVLTGKTNPSGRLPFTIAKKRSDYSADVNYFPGLSDTPASFEQAQLPYTEKLEVRIDFLLPRGLKKRKGESDEAFLLRWPLCAARGRSDTVTLTPRTSSLGSPLVTASATPPSSTLAHAASGLMGKSGTLALGLGPRPSGSTSR